MTASSQIETPELFVTDCPPWCTLPAGHPVDGILQGRPARSHPAPDDFGDFISVSADEFTDDQGTLKYWVTISANDDNINDPVELLACLSSSPSRGVARGPPVTTTSVPIQITCPSWCSITPQEHAGDLWFNGGDVFHHAEPVTIEDPAGFRTALAEPKFYPPAEVSLTTTTNPEGRETASPIFYVNDHEHSLEQFEALMESAGRMIALYRDEVPA